LSEAAFTYRAFISYSHSDAPWCDWLHRALERVRIDADLIGLTTPLGAVPRHLRPVFRDREDFAAGHSLNEQTLSALLAAQFLIVMASPNSAKSHYVNEEIRQFKAFGGAKRVLACIVDGEPDNWFAPALRFAVGADGAISDTPEEPIAADAREAGDGKQRALVKLVAGLTGLNYDDLWMRHVREAKKRAALMSAGGGLFAVTALAAGVFSYEHFGTKETVARHGEQIQSDAKRIEHLEALVTQLIGTSPAEAAPGLKEAVTGAVQFADRGAQAGDVRLRQALDLLRQNKVAEAEALFAQVARASELAARRSDKEAAEAYRHLGAIAGLRDPKAAREAYGKAVALDPEDREALYWHGWLQ